MAKNDEKQKEVGRLTGVGSTTWVCNQSKGSMTPSNQTHLHTYNFIICQIQTHSILNSYRNVGDKIYTNKRHL